MLETTLARRRLESVEEIVQTVDEEAQRNEDQQCADACGNYHRDCGPPLTKSPSAAGRGCRRACPRCSEYTKKMFAVKCPLCEIMKLQGMIESQLRY